MEGNKDEALRCVRIAEEAIASGNKDGALKFLRIAQRLNRDLPLQPLLEKCDRLDSHSVAATAGGSGASPANGHSPRREGLNGERNYTEENVQLIIKGKSDYYAILGLEKSCSPDKNKAPGSEDAFKKVSEAFKCLSDDGSRWVYDQTGTAADDFENTSGASPANGHSPRSEGLNGERNFTEENVQLIREIKGKSDYYAILGLEKSCSVEEIRNAYRKLSLKVHPDKNKAPGSEDAFKKVSEAFKCLSDDGSRWVYDLTGTAADDFENTEVNTFKPRRSTTPTRDFFEDKFDPDKIFRASFGHSDVFGRNNHDYRTFRASVGHSDVFGRNNHVYRTRRMRNPNHQHRHEFNAGSGGRHHIVILLILLLLFFIIVLLAYLPFLEPEYSLYQHDRYQIPKTTEQLGVQFFVKSAAFDANYPPGTDAREAVEENVIKNYRIMLRRYCRVETRRRSSNRDLPAPHCDKLHNFAVVA